MGEALILNVVGTNPRSSTKVIGSITWLSANCRGPMGGQETFEDVGFVTWVTWQTFTDVIFPQGGGKHRHPPFFTQSQGFPEGFAPPIISGSIDKYWFDSTNLYLKLSTSQRLRTSKGRYMWCISSAGPVGYILQKHFFVNKKLRN